MSDDPASDIVKGCILERPKVIYNQKTGKYVMYFHLELKGMGYAAARTGVAVSDKVTGPYKFLKSLRPNAGIFPVNMTEAQRTATITPEDIKGFSPSEKDSVIADGLYVRRDLKTGQMSRDMTLYVDDDQKAYHIYSSEENKTLHIAELTDDYLDYTGKYYRIDPAGWNEAPSLFKKDGRYYMITSGCTGWNPNPARLLVADHICGPWKRLPDNPAIGLMLKPPFTLRAPSFCRLPEGRRLSSLWQTAGNQPMLLMAVMSGCPSCLRTDYPF